MLCTAEGFYQHIPTMAMVYNDHCKATTKVFFWSFHFTFPLQVSDPVAAEFSLNTQMFLLSKKELWISDGSMGFGEGADVAFTKGKKSQLYIQHIMKDETEPLLTRAEYVFY